MVNDLRNHLIDRDPITLKPRSCHLRHQTFEAKRLFIQLTAIQKSAMTRHFSNMEICPRTTVLAIATIPAGTTVGSLGRASTIACDMLMAALK